MPTDLIKISSKGMSDSGRYLNIAMSPFQATEALFTAYHRERLFARSFKSKTPELIKERVKERFDIDALALWMATNKHIFRVKERKEARSFIEVRKSAGETQPE